MRGYVLVVRYSALMLFISCVYLAIGLGNLVGLSVQNMVSDGELRALT